MEVIGYVYEGDIYCKTCLTANGGPDPNDEDSVGPVFDTDEGDAPVHCGGCREFLGGALTRDGVRFLKELYLERHVRNEALWKAYMDYYHGVDWYFIPTFIGPMNPRGEFKDW